VSETFLILGANSFYGSNFMKCVEAHGDEAICLSRPQWELGGPIDDEGDYIVNFASQSLVAESWDAPEDWMHTNACATTTMFRRLIGHDFKKYVHVSTPEVYGSTEGWVDETFSKWEPTTPYAVSRMAGDKMLMAFHKAYKFPAVITRTANIYGPGQPDHRIIPATFKKIKEGQKLGLHGNGKSVRCFIHVKDACEATYKVAKQGTPGQTYHISTNHQIKIYDLVKKICTLMGKRMEDVVEQTPERLGKDFAYLLKSERIRNMGWRDTITLDRGLQEICESYRSS
jgi:dTDP-glucose 4,6-dehydratase